MPLTLSREFSDILNEMEKDSSHLFITGKAGTGKSTLLQLFRNTTRKKVAILAPTGIAALNVKGQTIHSFFGFPPRMLNPKEIKKSPKHKLFKNINAIVIDEISMVRADMLDNIDLFLQRNRGNPLPFGGVQMLFFGDLFQLPPVISSDFEKQYFQNFYDSPYFFSSKVLQSKISYPMIELRQVYRQEEIHFIRLLDNIRLNQFDHDDLALLNSRYIPLPENKDYYITLCTKNFTSDIINKKTLDMIDKPAQHFKARVTGEFQNKLFPTDEILTLKEEAQVMFVKNDPQKRFVNGTIGKVSKVEEDSLFVAVKNEGAGTYEEIEVERMEWEIIKYTRDPKNEKEITTTVIGTFVQYPLKLAWAITIHKSQGKTFNRVIIDLGSGAFEYGQTYVALSRCRTLEGIILKMPIRATDIMTDERINSFYQNKLYYL